MLKTLAGSTLGVGFHTEKGSWFAISEDKYDVVAKFAYDGYPANPNGSHFDIAMMASNDGRHLVMMPHIERSTSMELANYPKTEMMKFHLGTKPLWMQDCG